MVDAPVSDLTRKPLANGVANSESTLTQLVSGIADDAQQLIRQQYQMLRAEIREDIRRTTSAAKYMSIGAAGVFVGMLFLVVSTPLLLNWLFDLPPWGGWAIIGGTLFVAGAIALYVGKRMFAKFNPLPDKTLNAIEENLSWIAKPRS